MSVEVDPLRYQMWKGKDADGRPILYVKPSKMDLETYDTENYLRAHVYLLERGMELMDDDVTT